ncbi:hypothetical protein BJX70DRAFT_179830 [Aspergillus crustosus]
MFPPLFHTQPPLFFLFPFLPAFLSFGLSCHPPPFKITYSSNNPPANMRMTWTPEKNAQLLLGILDQLKQQNVKISLYKLADYMGPGCTFKAVEGQLTKLKKQAAQNHTSAAAETGTENGGASASASASAPTTPAATPKKRSKANTPAKTGSPVKKAKGVKRGDALDDDEEDDEMEALILDEVKRELAALKK